MNKASIIFPNQLFKISPLTKLQQNTYLVEEELFFKQYKFHQQKILFHRASMKCYENYLSNCKIPVTYIDAVNPLSNISALIAHLHQINVSEITFIDVIDNWLHKKITTACKKYRINYVAHLSPGFISTIEEANIYFEKRTTYFQTGFYIYQRKKRNILVDAKNNPDGGSWTYDVENRLRFPAKEKAPVIKFASENIYISDAKKYVIANFHKNYGSIEKIIYPVDFSGAEKWLDEFLKERFQHFGIYEDAMVTKENFLHHSVISPLLNVGLLQPQQIINKAVDVAAKYNVPLNSLEGFVRQILGWREFIRIVYEREGTMQRNKNYWRFYRKIPNSFWTGNTGILPVDNVIKKVLQTGYCHHIERLMVLGNFMLLCEFDPNEVYRWFMEMFVDAYDWVMVPNVYGMSQFADGGLMASKPYISSSNYLLKMSDYEKGTWMQIWDGLFWRFMHTHRSFFLKNPRLGMLVKNFDKMPAEKKQSHINNAEDFLNNLS